MFRAAAICLLALTLGCANSGFFGVPLSESVTVNPAHDRSLTFYHAYGDSITFGSALGSPPTQAYPNLLAYEEVLPLINYAYPGDLTCDVAAEEIFPNADNPSTAHKGLYTLLVSTNDANQRGAGAYKQVFNLCHQAAVAWLALPAEYKVLATAATVSASGTTHLETANNWNARTTDAQNASVSFPLALAAAGPVYAWYRITDGNPGTFTCSIDGRIVTASLASGTIPAIVGNRTTGSLALLRLPGLAAGAHTLTFTQTSAGASGMGIVAVGVPPGAIGPGFSRVFVGTTPRTLLGGTALCSIDDAPCQAYIADITANVAIFKVDGLDVTLFDTRKYMTGTATDMADIVHPNLVGHQEIRHAIDDVLN